MAWARVQSKSATGSGLSTQSITFTATPTTGNKIIVGFSKASTATTITSVKDGAGNSLTLGAGPTASATSEAAFMYFYDVPATPNSTITVIYSGGADTSMVAQEISGLLAGNTTAALDGTAGTLTGATSTPGSPTYSSTAASEYLWMFYGDEGAGTTATVPTGGTADASNVNASGNDNACVGYKNSTGGSETSNWTLNGAPHWSELTVAFKLAGGGGGATLPELVMAPRN